MGNFVFLAIFDICAVVYIWFISLLPHIVLDNLLDYSKQSEDIKNEIIYDTVETDLVYQTKR